MVSERTIFETIIPELYAAVSSSEMAVIQRLCDLVEKGEAFSTSETLAFEQDILACYSGYQPASKSLKPAFQSSDLSPNFVLAKGMYLSSFLSESIGRVKYDSLQSELLSQFPQPLAYSLSERTEFLNRIKDKFSLTSSDVSRIKSETDYIISNLHVKRGIVDFFQKRLATGLSHNILFESVTGIKALSHDTIDITLTNATLFFIFDFSEHGLDSSRHFSLDDHLAIGELLNTLNLESNSQRANFPAVGEWSSIKVNDQLITDIQGFLAAEYNFQLTEVAIRDTLITMVFLLPRKTADAFLVHDAYGHAWQENLCEFEHLYRYLADLKKPADLSKVSLGQEQSSNEIVSVLTEFFFAYYSRKLAVANNAVLAELTADVIEFHLQKDLMKQGKAVPTSSALRELVLFLDLTLSDIKKHFHPIQLAISAELSSQQLDKMRQLLTSLVKPNEVEPILSRVVEALELIHINFIQEAEMGLSKAQVATLNSVLSIYPYLKHYGDQLEPFALHQYILSLTTYFQEFENHGFFRLAEFSESFEPIL
ncbi:hypothetical protein [Pleionea sediminis]|uniref:hypothetical protein n=1 Tax=Pleionea sediminis TaxID=2569479 RepID=UPI0011853714|nr:hypothetical protein [Pleionea sediminis]